MTENIHTPSFLETPQQDLQALISHEAELDKDLQHALDRSCTPHCIEAIAELHGLHIPSLDRLNEYITFLRENGAHPQNGSNNEELYGVDDGWYNIAIADLLRQNGFEIISQNLAYDPQTSNLEAARNSGRVRNEREQRDLEKLTVYGGPLKESWLHAIDDTLSNDGYPVVSVEIPSSKFEGVVGRHTVVITSLGPDVVTYFDPDKLALDRYKEDASQQEIQRLNDNKLMYTQTVDKFLGRMTGEVMHIFPPFQKK